MNLLALDTSTTRAAIALARPDGTIRVATTDPTLRHGRGLIPAIRDLLRGSGLRVADLDALAVGLGPGSYTGLRVGVTAAKTLAYAAGRPLIGLDSLEVLALHAPPDALLLSVVADAQRRDLYVADFRRDVPGGPLLRLSPTRVESAASWAASLATGTLVLGPGEEPRGEALAALALDAFARGRRDEPWFLEPVYLRRSAAEDQWDAAKETTSPQRQKGHEGKM